MPQYFDADGNPVNIGDESGGRMATLPRKVVRKLEKDAEDGRRALAENEQLKRERAFVAAGIPLQDSRAAYFIAGYTGPQEPDAIREEWNKLFGGGAQQQNAIDQELAAQAGGQALTSGVGSPAPDVLAQRNAELASLSQTDPAFSQKFDAIMQKYTPGGVGSLVG